MPIPVTTPKKTVPTVAAIASSNSCLRKRASRLISLTLISLLAA
ncbi:MAG: hypothetical protein BWY91_01878 [bacterium ADurb.BinA028]|nr:MAG: hypothetical protein BWY91_01878 [bacterium ADurb.BinA028]